MNVIETDIQLLEMHFSIDGDWEVKDTINFLSSIQNLYNFYGFGYNLKKKWYKSALTFKDKEAVNFLLNYSFHPFISYKENELIDYQFNYKPYLKLVRIKYSSPGFGDILGAGEIIGHLKEVLFKVIDIYRTKEKNKLENELLKSEIQKKLIENELLKLQRVKEQISILKELEIENTDIKNSLAYEVSNLANIAMLVGNKKLKEIK